MFPNSFIELFKLIFAFAAIIVAAFTALLVPDIGFVICGVVMAAAAFWIRKRFRLIFGICEVAAGIFTLYQTSTVGRGGFNLGFSSAFQTHRWQLIALATLGGVYILVRGFDNIDQGWHTQK
jgi:hypothetical protein